MVVPTVRKLRLSAVIPTLDEAVRIGSLVARLSEECDEVVVSDGGSGDDTVARARASGAKVVEGGRGRGPQLHHGVRAAVGELLWFVHADAVVPEGAGPALRLVAEDQAWGSFRVSVDSRDPRLRFTASWMNHRAALTGSCTGDMGMWTRRSFYETLGGFEGLGAFEDLEFADRARRFADHGQVPMTLGLSSRRWKGEGTTRTILRMWRLRRAYRLGGDPRELAASYASKPR
jgi:rSAM/selenodomain-associated transferase 2